MNHSLLIRIHIQEQYLNGMKPSLNWNKLVFSVDRPDGAMRPKSWQSCVVFNGCVHAQMLWRVALWDVDACLL